MDSAYYDYNYGPQMHPVIGSHDFFGSDDLGYQASMQRSHSGLSDSTHDSLLDGSLNSHYMQRTGSRHSASSSHESQLSPSSQSSPNYFFGYSNSVSDNFYYQVAPPYNHHLDSTSSTTATTGSYVLSTPRNGNVPYYAQIMTVDTPVSPTSPDMRLSSQNEKVEFVCLHPGCEVKPFARNADLKRHMDHRHGDVAKLEKWFCDRKNCPRSEKGYRAMLDRMGRSSVGGGGGGGGGNSSSSSTAASTGGSGAKDNGVGPFFRKDHFKAHLRDIHKEALWKRDPKSDRHWLDGKLVDADWWRCHKCLGRVYVRKNGWKCPCGVALEGDVVSALSRKMNESRQRKNAESLSRYPR